MIEEMYVGTNCNKYNLNKYGPKKLSTRGCATLPSGAIVAPMNKQDRSKMAKGFIFTNLMQELYR